MMSEQIRKRRQNQSAILECLHFSGPMQRTAISEATGIRKNSVTSITSELLSVGIVREELPGSMRSPLVLAGDGHGVACAAVSPKRIVFAAVGVDGTVFDRTHIDFTYPLSGEGFMASLEEGLQEVRSHYRGRLLGCGIACPGLIDPQSGRLLKAVNLGLNVPLELARVVSRHLAMPTCVENDVRAELWSCNWFGCLGKDAENLLYVGLKQGLACAIMTRGRLNIGERFAAGEIGHFKIAEDGRQCLCGRTDCLECYCNTNAILSDANAVLPSPVRSLSQLASGENLLAVQGVLDKCAFYLARGLSGIVAATDPHTVLLGTPSEDFSKVFAPVLKSHLDAELSGLVTQNKPISATEDVETGALKGIAGIVIQRAFRNRDFSSES